ncbi:uroporphyrinogen-III synthase [Bacillus lacus]|uniref:Uroporphyrinogen-III synthase n=1 Tax=Metabacillus lacus TaxID=1983721 RepID=A0A7X2M0J4_9BACI|nr:uroporphyrinogen-III synthase [Metabacillus lacus]MRX74228.1 uroporphyrinogen-III synthase [Metabacillus lacus]
MQQQPLKGKTVLVTREQSQAGALTELIEKAGGAAVAAPLIYFQGIISREVLMLIKEAASYDWIVLTSINGVRFFQELLKKASVPAEALSCVKFAAVGNKTKAALEKAGIQADLVPKKFVAEELAKSLIAHAGEGSRVLIIRGSLSRSVLLTELSHAGMSAKELTIYRTVHNEAAEEQIGELVSDKKLDIATFTSSSTVNSFMEIIHKLGLQSELNSICFAAIGPVTGKTLKKYGLTCIQPNEYTMEAMVKEIIKAVSKEEI